MRCIGIELWLQVKVRPQHILYTNKLDRRNGSCRYSIVPSEFSEEDKDDDRFFEQEPSQDNRELMVKVWEDLEKIYKHVKWLLRRRRNPTTH